MKDAYPSALCNQIGYQQNAQAGQARRDSTEFQIIGETLGDLIQRCNVNTDNLLNLSARLLGEQPSSTEKNAGLRPCRMGMVGSLRDQLDALSDNLALAEDTISRLRAAL